MKDRYNREIDYLRVSVTQRCNLNFIYCGKSDCGKKQTELSLDEIGARFDLTRERVRQIREKAIRRLRGHSSQNLRPYL